METKKLVTSAMMISIATVLSMIQPFQLPFGGGITVASMVPIVLAGYMYGTRSGMLCGVIYGLVQMLLGSRVVAAFFLPGESKMTFSAAIAVCVLDYIVAYTVLGFGGVFRDRVKSVSLSVILGAILATGLRYVVHILSGAVFFGSWAEWFFTQEGFYDIGGYIMEVCSPKILPWIYSGFYNGLYMIPEIVITAVTAPLIYRICEKRNKL